MTWNLDGLDKTNLQRRTIAVISLIQKHEPDIVFFQEVIPVTAEYIEKNLLEYKCIKGGDQSYFTMTLLRVFTIFYDKHYIMDFPGSKMGRNSLITEAHVGKVKLQLLNCHLESTTEYTKERVRQLKCAFEKCMTFSNDYTVIFGGDLNLRDKEADTPGGFYDLWELCGSPKQYQYTWDMTKNFNLEGFGRFRPKMRFDRVYFRFNERKNVKPKHFALTGFEKVHQSQMFPSDHWAIVILFDLDHSN